MYFDYRDIFRAVRLGLSPKKIWAFFCGLSAAFILYGIFGYLSHIVSGRSLSDVWIMFGLVPAMPWPGSGAFSWVLWSIGIVGALLIYMLTAAIVSRLATEQLKGNEFYEVREAIGFLKSSWKSIFGGPAVVAVFAVFILFCGVLIGWWGRIPALGELTVSILSLPIYLVCLFLAFLFVSFIIGLFYSPVISGATKGDAFDNLFEVFSSITAQPWRLVLYTGLVKALSLTAFIIFAWFSISGLGMVYQVLSWAMGGKFVDIAVAAFNQYTPPLATNYLMSLGIGSPALAGIASFAAANPSLNWLGQLSAFIMGMSLNIIRLLVLAYFFSVFVTGQTIIYGIIVMKRDQRNIFIDEDTSKDTCTPPENEFNEMQQSEPIKKILIKKKASKIKPETKIKKR